RGYKTLLDQAESNANIASALVGRSDLSPELFRKLVAQASATVQQRLLATADVKMKETIQGVIRAITVEVARTADRAVPVGGRRAAAQLKSIDRGKLRAELVDYATAGRINESTTAFAALSELSIDTVRQLMTRQDYELLLIVGKACGLGWVAARALLELAAKS